MTIDPAHGDADPDDAVNVVPVPRTLAAITLADFRLRGIRPADGYLAAELLVAGFTLREQIPERTGLTAFDVGWLQARLEGVTGAP